jgi:hypothetical protein
VTGQVAGEMDQPAWPAAVGIPHSTAMRLVSDSLAYRQDRRVPDSPLEFPVVIASLACLLGFRFADVFASAHVALLPFASRWGNGLPHTAESTEDLVTVRTVTVLVIVARL